MRIPPVAHTSLEYHRWFVRSTFRPDGLRYARQMRSPVAAPVLHLHGAVDSCIPARPPAARAGTSRGRTGGRSSREPATSRTRNGRSPSTRSCSAGSPTPSRTGDRPGRRPATGTPAGRARNARPRDELGRPLPRSGGAGRAAHPRRPGRLPRRGGRPRRPAARRGPAVPRPRGLRGGLEVRAGAGARAVARPGPDRGGPHARPARQRARRGGAAAPGRRRTSPRSRARRPRSTRACRGAGDGPRAADRAGRPWQRPGGRPAAGAAAGQW